MWSHKISITTYTINTPVCSCFFFSTFFFFHITWCFFSYCCCSHTCDLTLCSPVDICANSMPYDHLIHHHCAATVFLVCAIWKHPVENKGINIEITNFQVKMMEEMDSSSFVAWGLNAENLLCTFISVVSPSARCSCVDEVFTLWVDETQGKITALLYSAVLCEIHQCFCPVIYPKMYLAAFVKNDSGPNSALSSVIKNEGEEHNVSNGCAMFWLHQTFRDC